MQCRALVPAFAILTLALVGCGEDSGIGLVTHPVSGTITTPDNQPVANASIIFTNLAGSYSASAQSDGAGKYQLATGADEGAPAGEYVVSVSGGGGVVPKIYHDPRTTPLKEAVQSGENTIDIQLQGRVQPPPRPAANPNAH